MDVNKLNDYFSGSFKFMDTDSFKFCEEKYMSIIENMKLGLLEVDNNDRIIIKIRMMSLNDVNKTALWLL